MEATNPVFELTSSPVIWERGIPCEDGAVSQGPAGDRVLIGSQREVTSAAEVRRRCRRVAVAVQL